jgi:hypothetical protein
LRRFYNHKILWLWTVENGDRKITEESQGFAVTRSTADGCDHKIFQPAVPVRPDAAAKIEPFSVALWDSAEFSLPSRIAKAPPAGGAKAAISDAEDDCELVVHAEPRQIAGGSNQWKAHWFLQQPERAQPLLPLAMGSW